MPINENNDLRRRPGRPRILGPREERIVLRKTVLGWAPWQLAMELGVTEVLVRRTLKRYGVTAATTVDELLEIEAEEPELQDPEPTADTEQRAAPRLAGPRRA